jgi:hypothetical protein
VTVLKVVIPSFLLLVGVVLVQTTAAQDDPASLQVLGRTVQTLLSGDDDAVRELIMFSVVACEQEPIGLGAPPICLEEETEGTLVEVFPTSACEGFYVRPTNIAGTVNILSRSDAQLAAVHLNAKIDTSFFGEHVAILNNTDLTDPTKAIGVWINDGSITGLHRGCGQNASELAADFRLGAKLELPAVTEDPTLPNTGQGGSQIWSEGRVWLAVGAVLLAMGAGLVGLRLRLR